MNGVDDDDHAIEKLDRAVFETRALLRKSQDAPYLPDLYFQLAELFVERSRIEHARAMARQIGHDNDISNEASLVVQLTKRLAIDTYQKILVEFADYPCRDQAMFFMGHEYRELGAFDDMTKTYRQLIDKYPSGMWAQHARLVLADLHFDRGDWDEAEKYYRGILALDETQVHPSARYKLGWIRVYQENFTEALEYYRQAVLTAREDAAPKMQAGTASRPLDLKREALLAMARPFAEVRQGVSAEAYFAPLADNRATYLEVMRALARRYTMRERPFDAATAWREVVRWGRDGEVLVEAIEKIVDTVQQVAPSDPNRRATLVTDVAGLGAAYGALAAEPPTRRERLGALPINIESISTATELQARDLLTRAQKEVAAHPEPALQQHVAQAYDSFLHAFDRSPQLHAMQANAAAALLQADRLLPAARAFEDVAHQEDDVQAQDDIYRAVAAYYSALEADRRKRQGSVAREGLFDKLQLMRAREGLRQLGTYFVQHYPRDDHVPTVRFNVARMAYQQGELDEAVRAFSAFVDDYPTHKDAGTAGRLALDALSQLDRLEAMQKLARHFAEDARQTDLGFRAEARRLAAAAGTRQLEVTVATADQAEFGAVMMHAWEQHKDAPEGEKYLYAAFSKFKSERRFDEASLFGDKLMGAYPKNPWASEVMATLAAMAAQTVDFDRAAAIYEQYAVLQPNRAEALGFVQTAAQMRILLGQPVQAMRDEAFVAERGSLQERRAASRRLMALAERSGDWQRLGAAPTVSGDELAHALWAGLAAVHAGDPARGVQLLTRATQMPPNPNGGQGVGPPGGGDVDDTALLARARFELARLTHASFSAIAFGDAEGAEAVLSRKLDHLKAAEAQYVTAVQVGVAAWGIAATYELSRLYRGMSVFIERAPLPPGVAEADYRAALARQANPYAQRANQTLAACAQKAEQLTLLTSFAAACARGGHDEVESPLPLTPPPGPAAAAFVPQLRRLRAGLMKNADDTILLRQLAQQAVAYGDFYAARVALYRLDELHDHSARGLLGLVLWHIGELDTAKDALVAAQRTGDHRAAINLFGLLHQFGYTKRARAVLPAAQVWRRIDLGAPDIHPAAAAALRALGASR